MFVWGCLGCGREGEKGYWVADSAAGAVVALDPELLVLERVSVEAPRLLAANRALWVVSSEGERDRLDAFQSACDAGREGQREPVYRADHGALFDLVSHGAEGALALERVGPQALLWTFGLGRERCLLGAFPAGEVVGSGTGGILVGCASGELIALDVLGAVRITTLVPGPVRALAPGPRRGEWWVFFGEEPPHVALLGSGLERIWSGSVPRGALGLAAVAGREEVWLGGWERAYGVGPAGVLEHELDLPAGEWRVQSASAQSILLLGEGAVLEVRVGGGTARIERSQGGFRELAGLVEVSSDLLPPP